MRTSYLRCRTCLKKCLQNNSTIVSNVDLQFNCKYDDIVHLITGISVQKFNVICVRCRQQLLEAFKFRLQVQKADEKLKSGGFVSEDSDGSDENGLVDYSKENEEKIKIEYNIEEDRELKRNCENVNNLIEITEEPESNCNVKESPVISAVQNSRKTHSEIWSFFKKSNRKSKRATCDLCQKTFSFKTTTSNLRKHLQARHTLAFRILTPADCSSSQESTVAGRSIQRSKKRKETNRWLCPDCGKTFAHKNGFIRHTYLHTDNKKFVCDYCNKGFNASDQLIYHIRKHTGITPLVCPYCDRKFCKPRTYTHHLMTHTGEKPHKCTICQAAFIQKHSLKVHLRKKHLSAENEHVWNEQHNLKYETIEEHEPAPTEEPVLSALT